MSELIGPIYETDETIDLTAITKLKHTALYEAAKELGSQSALARALDVSPQEVGRWLNLRSCPPKYPTPKWPKERLDKLGDDLFAITGLTIDELFPKKLRDADDFLNRPKTYEHTKRFHVERLKELSGEAKSRMTLPDPSAEASKKDTIDQLMKVSKRCLTWRENEVLKYRFGLKGEKPKTLSETAKEFKVTKSRIQQIEQRALGKLRAVIHTEKIEAL